MKAYPTKNGISEETRAQLISLVNQQLADLIDLGLQTKQAHWNVTRHYCSANDEHSSAKGAGSESSASQFSAIQASYSSRDIVPTARKSPPA